MTTHSPTPLHERIPSPCPVCGAYSLAPDQEASTLLTVSNALVYKALEAMGKFIVRAERARFKLLGNRPFHEAHTLWQAEDATVDKALRNAWDVVPALLDVHGNAGVTPTQVTKMLDDYVHDLVITGTPHTLDELAWRYEHKLGLPVFDQRHDYGTS